MMTGGSGSFGNLFDLRKHPSSPGVLIESLDIYTDVSKEVTVEIWTREGSAIRAPFPDAKWEMIAKATVPGAGTGSFTAIPASQFKSVPLSDSVETRGFLVILTSPDLRYTPHEKGEYPPASDEYGIIAHDANIAITSGDGVGSYPYRSKKQGSTTKFRAWNGAVHYKVGTPPAMEAAPPLSSTTILSTMMTGGSGSFGNLFDLRKHPSSSGVRVTSLDIYTDVTKEITCEIWTREGSAIGAPFPDAKWEMIAKVTLLGAGEGSFTSIPPSKFKSVEISNTIATRGFLVILTSPDIRYTPHEKGEYPPASDEYGIIAHDANIAITSGDVVGNYPYRPKKQGSTTKFRAWNGAVHYEVLPALPG